MTNIEKSMAEYKAWCKKLGIETISDVNKIIDAGGANWLINVSEIWHEQKISEISKAIKDNIENKKIILISGPSSSGKTSFATKLQLHLKVLGINAVSISLDNYYKKDEDMPLNRDGKPDYEALESIDYQLFNEHVKELIEGKEVIVPIYHFGKDDDEEESCVTMKLESDEVIIVEGIHGLNPKLTENISNENKYKIYCSAVSALTRDDGVRIKARTTRLIRRLVRDYYFRNSDYKLTFELWPHVEEGSQKNVFPYTDTADIIFNSSLLYELCVYKKYFDEVCADVSEKDEEYEAIQELRELLESFRPITAVENTPPTSLVREFVGGSTLLNG